MAGSVDNRKGDLEADFEAFVTQTKRVTCKTCLLPPETLRVVEAKRSQGHPSTALAAWVSARFPEYALTPTAILNHFNHGHHQR